MQTKHPNVPQTTVAAISTPPLCIFCQSNHPSRTCPNFSTIESRRTKLEQMQKCSRCTQSHDRASCQVQFTPCKTCGKINHHGFLCFRLLKGKGKGKGMSVLVLTLHMVFARTSAGYPQPPTMASPMMVTSGRQPHSRALTGTRTRDSPIKFKPSIFQIYGDSQIRG